MHLSFIPLSGLSVEIYLLQYIFFLKYISYHLIHLWLIYLTSFCMLKCVSGCKQLPNPLQVTLTWPLIDIILKGDMMLTKHI